MKQPRPEQDIFDDLRTLTARPGFAHVIAYFCLRDNFTWYHDGITAKDMQHLYSQSRLIRNEIFTLIGLMVQAEPDYAAPPPKDAISLAAQAEALLEELHDRLGQPLTVQTDTSSALDTFLAWWGTGDAMREPIFYGGEAAFSFQNCAFASEKYAADDPWLVNHKGASIDEMIAVAMAIGEVQYAKATLAQRAGEPTAISDNILPAFIFSVEDIEKVIDLPPEKIRACIHAFMLSAGSRNDSFIALNDYNAVNGSPILAVGGESYLLFHFNALAEAVYESPLYWLIADKEYKDTAFKHRGAFTEAFALRRLTSVFGARVYQGVNIERKKGERLGEIDALVLFGDRAIVLQAKSKRLTLESRRGNELKLKEDFKGAVQDAYDQAIECATALFDPDVQLTHNGHPLKLSVSLKQIYPICLVSDHYPALAFQTDQFLTRRELAGVLTPLVIDVFTLDVMAEFLDRPLRFLSYLDLRSLHAPKLHASHEITLLSYHLKYNLWVEPDDDFVMLHDDFAADIEIAMGARRLGLPGALTPKGILTAIDARVLDRVIAEIEARPFGAMIDLVLLLYQLSGNAMKELADGIDRLLLQAALKGQSDFSIGFAGTGLTLHSNNSPHAEAERRLEGHTMLRKYRTRSSTWYGLSLSPNDGRIRTGKKVEFPWARDEEFEREGERLGINLSLEQPAKLGRNDPCHCGSGKKYKKCHLKLV